MLWTKYLLKRGPLPFCVQREGRRPQPPPLPPLLQVALFHHDSLQSSADFRAMSDPEKNCHTGQPWRFQTLPLLNHRGPHRFGGWKHSGRWGLRPGWGSRQSRFWPEYRGVFPHRCPGLGYGRPLLCWIWGPSTQDWICVSIHLRHGRRAVGLHHWLESHPVICHRYASKTSMSLKKKKALQKASSLGISLHYSAVGISWGDHLTVSLSYLKYIFISEVWFCFHFEFMILSGFENKTKKCFLNSAVTFQVVSACLL